MSISSVTSAPAPLKPPEASEPKPPVAQNTDAAQATQPTVLAALPPGQGTRIDQLA